MKRTQVLSAEEQRAMDAMTAEDKAVVFAMNALKKSVSVQAVIIAALSVFLVFFVPLAKTTYIYYAITPDERVKQLIGLNIPNMTPKAIKDWTATSIVELLTIGFGDLEIKVSKQRWRFTEEGWKDYVNAFIALNLATQFKSKHLVLTAAPTDTPVISRQGIDSDGIYKWVVRVPIILTFTTNNNVSQRVRRHAVLKITRVPVWENPMGIAIQSLRI